MLKEILEEIKIKKKNCLDIVKIEIDPMEITIHREQYKGLRMAEDIIRKNMNDGWIPVEERLPENAEDVIATLANGEGITLAWYDNDDWLSSIDADHIDVIAWMP
ncbi:MAG TPA: DUF551 domain-containing protein, partial [Candidatus Eisenbergiella merdavium]|nr:DUF551 domain-containing protein [Candidatus Eisenbergiella merdavium]